MKKMLIITSLVILLAGSGVGTFIGGDTSVQAFGNVFEPYHGGGDTPDPM